MILIPLQEALFYFFSYLPLEWCLQQLRCLHFLKQTKKLLSPPKQTIQSLLMPGLIVHKIQFRLNTQDQNETDKKMNFKEIQGLQNQQQSQMQLRLFNQITGSVSKKDYFKNSFYQNFIDELRTGYFFVNEKLTLMFANQELKNILRIEDDNLIGEFILNLMVYLTDKKTAHLLTQKFSSRKGNLSKSKSVLQMSIFTKFIMANDSSVQGQSIKEILGVGVFCIQYFRNFAISSLMSITVSNQSTLNQIELTLMITSSQSRVSKVGNSKSRIQFRKILALRAFISLSFLAQRISKSSPFQPQFQRYLKRNFTYKIMKKLFMSFSHEFGTSLNCILTVAQAAYEESSIEPQIRNDFFLPIIKSGKILHSIVSDMIDYNHMLGKSFQLCIAPFNIKELIDEVMHLFANQINSKGIQVVLDFQDRLYKEEIVSDKQRIRQILINLLANAQKFTFSGMIRFSASIVRLASKNMIKFTVEDSGIGMKQEEQHRLNQLLQSGTCPEQQISQNTAGFGLGLFISSRIAETLSKLRKNQGGGIQFESKPSKGSKFWFHVANQSSVRLEKRASELSSPFIMVDKTNVLDLRRSDVSYFLIGQQSQQLRFSRKIEKTLDVKDEFQSINKKVDFLLSEDEHIEESLKDVMSVKQVDVSAAFEQLQNNQSEGEINAEFDSVDHHLKLV